MLNSFSLPLRLSMALVVVVLSGGHCRVRLFTAPTAGDRGEWSCVRAGVRLVVIVAMCTANQKGGTHHRSMLGRM